MGLGYDVVMKLCEQITGKNHHVYFDNLFTSVLLLNDLLNCKTYACSTVCMNKWNLPDAVKYPGRMVWGEYKTFQFGITNLVATVWQDNKSVSVLSTNCNPNTVLQANCQIGHQKHEWCWLQWSVAYAVWDWVLFQESMEVLDVVLHKYLNCWCICLVERSIHKSNIKMEVHPHQLLKRSGMQFNRWVFLPETKARYTTLYWPCCSCKWNKWWKHPHGRGVKWQMMQVASYVKVGEKYDHVLWLSSVLCAPLQGRLPLCIPPAKLKKPNFFFKFP